MIGGSGQCAGGVYVFFVRTNGFGFAVKSLL